MVVERKVIKDKMREYAVRSYLEKFLDRVGFSHIEIQKTPVGFNIIIHASKPGLIVGRGGVNIREIQETLQKKFNLESPVVDVREVESPNTDAQIMAENIGNQLMKFGAARFKAIGHKALEKIIQSGAIGAEIKMSGKIPSSRARAWKFYGGYLPKCGDVAIKKVMIGYKTVKLKSGIIGVTVKILPPGIRMPDRIYFNKDEIQVVEVSETESSETEKIEEPTKKKSPRKKVSKEKQETAKEEKKEAVIVLKPETELHSQEELKEQTETAKEETKPEQTEPVAEKGEQ